MAGTLRITRQQLAKFLGNDHDAIRQFETLFSTVAESDSTAVATEPEIVVETAAHEALARIERLERAFQMLELAPVSNSFSISDVTNISSVVNSIDTPPISPNSWDDEFSGSTLNTAWTKTDAGSIISVSNGKLKFIGSGAITASVKKAITRPFKVIAKLVWMSPHAMSYEDIFLFFGVTSGKSYNLGLQGRHKENQNVSLQSQRMNNDGSWNSETLWQRCPSNVVYVSIEDNGTNLIQKVSFNGEEWLTVRSEAYNAWCVVDYCGISANGYTGMPFAFYCEWIRRTV